MVELDQQHDGYGQIDERGSWFYEAIGNSAGMQGKTLGFGQVYLETSKDKDGNWLDGGKSYHLRVLPNAPVKQFWSFTLYDNQTRGPVMVHVLPALWADRALLQQVLGAPGHRTHPVKDYRQFAGTGPHRN